MATVKFVTVKGAEGIGNKTIKPRRNAPAPKASGWVSA